MARYEHLPIYKSALDLTVHIEKVVAGFSRYHKYTLGTELRERSRAVLMQVLRANNAQTAADRAQELRSLRDLIDALLLATRGTSIPAPSITRNQNNNDKNNALYAVAVRPGG